MHVYRTACAEIERMVRIHINMPRIFYIVLPNVFPIVYTISAET